MELIALHFYFALVFVVIAGACFGSFFNVCIYRIPLQSSIVTPGSRCAACGRAIPWQHNIPILSWLFLRGRAACCGVRIDFRYLAVEAMTAILFLALFLRFQSHWSVMVSYAIFVSMLLIASFIDIDYFIIPDRFSLGTCVAGLICCSFVPSLQQVTTRWAGFTESLRGAIVCGLALYFIAQVGSKVFKKEAMGMGDVKLIAGIGAFLGATSITFVLPVAALLGSVFGIFLVVGKKGAWGTRLPFGPFLAMAAILWIFGGAEMTANYWHHCFQVLLGV